MTSKSDGEKTPRVPNRLRHATGKRGEPVMVALQPADAARLRAAENVLRRFRRRSAIFGADAAILGDPAWAILLDLFVAYHRKSAISISSACIASGAAHTTALRYINGLVDRDLISRSVDPFDRRRQYLSLTPKGKRLMDRVLMDADQ